MSLKLAAFDSDPFAPFCPHSIKRAEYFEGEIRAFIDVSK